MKILLRTFQLPLGLAAVLLLPASYSHAQTVVQVAAGQYHSLVLKSDGTLYAMGWNHYGQLNDTTTTDRHTPVPVAAGVTNIAAGYFHSLFIKTNGSLWAVGYNGAGELGDNTQGGTLGYTASAEQIEPGGVTAIAGGQLHSLFVETDGSLYSMGANYYGELGAGPAGGANSVLSPQLVIGSGVKSVAAGAWHSLYVKTDGSLWGMGLDTSGQLGGGGSEFDTPVQIMSSGVAAAACGAYFSFFLKTDGTLWAMGDDSYAELGDGQPLYTSGSNNIEQIASNVSAVACGYRNAIFIKKDGSFWYTGLTNGVGFYNTTYLPQEILSNSVVEVSEGQYHSLIVKSDGSLWAMGMDTYGELGGTGTAYEGYPELIIPGISSPLPTYKLVSQLMANGNVQFTFSGGSGTNYSLDRTYNLSSTNWTGQVTNMAANGNTVLYTNTPNRSTNNYWRVRAVP